MIASILKLFGNNMHRSFGTGGLRFIDSGFTPVTGEEYYCFAVISDAAVNFTNAYEGDGATAKALTAGTYVYGKFTALTVDSGEIIAYRISK